MDIPEIADEIRKYGKGITLKTGPAYLLDMENVPPYLLNEIGSIIRESQSDPGFVPYRGLMEDLGVPVCIINKSEGNYDMLRLEGTRHAGLEHLEEEFCTSDDILNLAPRSLAETRRNSLKVHLSGMKVTDFGEYRL